MNVNLSLDSVSYKEKPRRGTPEAAQINNRIAKNPVRGIELSQAADFICNRGHAFSGTIFSDGKRCSDNFVSIQLCGLDFDGGIPYHEIEKMADYYDLPFCFSYHTFSSSPEKEKFRIVFLLDTEITNFDVAKMAIDMLMQIFPACDKSCSDVVRFFYGGKDLIAYQEKPIKLTDIADAYCRSLKEKKNSHYTRELKNFAKKHNVAVDGKRLRISEYHENGNFLPTTDNIYTELGNFLPNSDDGNAGEHPRYLIERYQESNDTSSPHPSQSLSQAGQKRVGRFAEIKYAGRYCRLYREFEQGINIGHDGRFHIMLSLLQIRDGKKLFLDIIKGTGNDLKKWRSTINSPYHDSYNHEQSCEKCPYYSECDHEGTLIKTVRKRAGEDNLKKEVRIQQQPENYISLKEGRRRLRRNIAQAIESFYHLTLIKAQTGIGKTHTYCDIIKEQYQCRRFLVALPNNNMKNEVGSELNKRGIPPESMVITPSHSEPGFPHELRRKIDEMYALGIYDQTVRIISDYIQDNKDSMSERDKKHLENFLEFKEKMRKEETRVVVTTHTRLSTLEDDFLKEFIIIVDEDILVSSFFLHTRDISLGTVRAVADDYGVCPESMRDFFTQILDAEDNKVYMIKDSAVASMCNLSLDMMQEVGLNENINDLFRATTFIKDDDTVHYYYPGKLPRTKCIILSATLDVGIYKKYFRLEDSDIVYIEEPLIKYKGQIIQYVAHPLGRSTLTEECMDEIASLVWNILGNDKKEDVKFITFMKYQNLIGERPYIANDLYFSKCLGSNALKGKNVVVMGTPFVIDRSYKLIGAYLGLIDDREEPRVRRVTYRGLEFFHMTYSDPLLRQLQCYWLTGELEQAVGRARLLSQDKTVIVFASVPCEQAEYICKEYLIKN